MKQPIESIASIALSIKLKSASAVNTLQSWHERRKRVKRVQNLRQSSSQIRVNPGNQVAQIHKARYFEIQLEQWRKQANPQTFGFKVGEVIATGNHPVVRLPVVKVGAK